MAENPFDPTMKMIRHLLNFLSLIRSTGTPGEMTPELAESLKKLQGVIKQLTDVQKGEMQELGIDEKSLKTAIERLKNNDPLQRQILAELDLLRNEILMEKGKVEAIIEEEKKKASPKQEKPKPLTREQLKDQEKEKAIRRRRRKFRGVGGEEGTIKL